MFFETFVISLAIYLASSQQHVSNNMDENLHPSYYRLHSKPISYLEDKYHKGYYENRHNKRYPYRGLEQNPSISEKANKAEVQSQNNNIKVPKFVYYNKGYYENRHNKRYPYRGLEKNPPTWKYWSQEDDSTVVPTNRFGFGMWNVIKKILPPNNNMKSLYLWSNLKNILKNQLIKYLLKLLDYVTQFLKNKIEAQSSSFSVINIIKKNVMKILLKVFETIETYLTNHSEIPTTRFLYKKMNKYHKNPLKWKYWNKLDFFWENFKKQLQTCIWKLFERMQLPNANNTDVPELSENNNTEVPKLSENNNTEDPLSQVVKTEVPVPLPTDLAKEIKSIDLSLENGQIQISSNTNKKIGIGESDPTTGDSELCITKKDYMPGDLNGIMAEYCVNPGGNCQISLVGLKTTCQQKYISQVIINGSNVKEEIRVPAGCVCVYKRQ